MREGGAWFCPHCGTHNLAVAIECSSCRTTSPFAPRLALVAAPPPPVVQHFYAYVPAPYAPVTRQPRSRAVYVVLAIFLGGLGIHNFYAARNGTGVAQLLIMLFGFWLILPIFIVWIWVIIEAIAVTTDGYGVPFA